MKQFKSAEDYKTATDIELVQHLISEIKAIKNDEVLREYLDFNYFRRPTKCGTYYCLAGYMASRSGIPITDERTGRLTEDLLAIFTFSDSYYSRALSPSTDRDEIGITWGSIFGVAVQGGTLEDRLQRAETILEDLKQKEK